MRRSQWRAALPECGAAEGIAAACDLPGDSKPAGRLGRVEVYPEMVKEQAHCGRAAGTAYAAPSCPTIEPRTIAGDGFLSRRGSRTDLHL
jgi:hypothetical protein